VKQLTAAGCTDEQAEGLTSALRRTQEVDLSSLATKADLKADLAEVKAAVRKWMPVPTIVIIGAVVALVKMIGHCSRAKLRSQVEPATIQRNQSLLLLF
jgi:hypothetical protein